MCLFSECSLNQPTDKLHLRAFRTDINPITALQDREVNGNPPGHVQRRFFLGGQSLWSYLAITLIVIEVSLYL